MTTDQLINDQVVSGLVTPLGLAVTPTPEPSALALLGIAGVSLGVRGRRRIV